MKQGIIVDNFAGGGGASEGIKLALGYGPHIAVNHDPQALAMHEANHPDTLHLCENIWQVDIAKEVAGRHVDLAWFSPDCKHFSKAKGGKPVEKNIRGLAWIVLKWAKIAKPDIIALENVGEFQTWGPLVDNLPCARRKGMTFRSWLTQLRNLGYVVEYKELRACDYGAPTIRRRLFVVARRDGKPIVWPEPTHGPKGNGILPEYRTAAECIDWSIPCPSIFGRKRPLAEATMRRIARGIQRYVIDAKEPFIVNMAHGGKVEPVNEPLSTIATEKGGCRAVVEPTLEKVSPFIAGVGGRAGQSPERPVDKPHQTITAKADSVLVTPVLVHTAHADVGKNGRKRWGKGEHPADAPLPTTSGKGTIAVVTPFITKFHSGSVGSSIDEPLPTVTSGGDLKRPAGNSHAMGLVCPTLIQVGYGEREGQAPRVPGIEKPLGTVVAGGKHALVSAFLAQHNSKSTGHPAKEPLTTITGKGHQQRIVTAFLAQHNTERKGVKAGRPVSQPLSSITASGTQQQLVTSHLVKLKGTCKDGAPVTEPAPTVQAGGLHIGEVRAFLIKYFGTDQDPMLEEPMHTVTSKHRFGLVMVHGQPYQIVDIGMRMLTPRELFRAQGFDDSYIIDPVYNGKPLTKTAQVRMCGNSVCPPLAEAIVRAQFQEAKQEAVA